MEWGELLEREHELKQLEILAEQAAGGHGAVAVVIGEPGIGKTCLIEGALADCRHRGFETYLAAASEMERRRPFGVIADALRLQDARDPRRLEIGRLLRGPGDVRDVGPGQNLAGAEFRVAERVVEYVEDRALFAPVAMLVEDLQWADPSSLVAVHWLAREAAQLPLLLVCTLRPGVERPDVRALLASLGSLGASRLELGPLSEGDVGDLVALAAGAPAGGRLLRLAALANGNPSHVRELVTALQADGNLTAGPDGRIDVAEDRLPVSLRQIVLRRLDGLTPATLDLLRTASILGSTFTVRELQLVLARPISQLVPSLRAAIDASTLVESEAGLAFRHELIREAVYDDIPRPLRRALHREAARLLAKADLPSERVAAHLMLGADPGDRQAVDWLRRAARDTAERSPSDAVELLQQAMGLCSAGDPARAEIVGELVQPLAWAGRQEELEALCRRGLEGEGRPDDEIAFRTGLSHSLFIQGRLAAAAAAYRQAAAAVAPGEAQHAMLMAYGALSGVMAGDRAAAETARPIASAEWGSVTAGIARLAVAVAELYSGRADHAVETFEALAAEGPVDRWGLQILRATALLDLDQVDKARTVLRQGARDFAANGTAARAAIYHHGLVAVEYAAGDFDAALAEHDTALSLAQASGQHWGVISLGMCAAIAVHRGDLDRAAQTIKVAEDEVKSGGPRVGDDAVARARYLMARATGDSRLALKAASEAWQQCASHGHRSHLTGLAVHLVRSAQAAGERERAEEAVATAEQVASVASAACWRACAAWARGLLEDDPELLVEAVALWRASQRPLHLALTLEDAADALARAGRVRDARPLAAEALVLFADVDAATDAARARRRWRAASLRLGTRGPRGRPRAGWGSLSDSELRVVRLVAEGRTNRDIAGRLFVTRNTVHTHLSSVLRKLGLSSRAELAAEAARRGL